MTSKTANPSASQTATEKAADFAHGAVRDAEETIQEAELKAREAAAVAQEKVEMYSQEAKAVATEKLSEVEAYVRQKPLQAAGIAFAAGILTAVLLRK